MIFFGQYRYNLDDKKRVIVPAKFREIAGAESLGFYVTTLDGEHLRMYTSSVWEKVTSELTEKAFPDPATLNLQTLIFGNADFVECDKQGRIALRNAAEFGIEREVVFLGVSNHIQIWSAEKYEAMMTRLKQNSGDLTKQLER